MAAGIAGSPAFLHRVVARRAHSAQWDILEILHRHVIEHMVGVLNGYQVVVACLGVDPISRRHHSIGSQSGNYVVHYVLRREADQARTFAIDIQRQPRIVEVLRDVDTAHVGESLDFLRYISRQLERAMHVVGAHLYIDRRGQALIDHRIHQASRLKVSASSGISRDSLSCTRDIYS